MTEASQHIDVRGDGFMRVSGPAFGTTGDLVEWFGPEMGLAHCSPDNALSYARDTPDGMIVHFRGTGDNPPPRRMSVFDPDHDWETGAKLLIMLDGVEQKMVEAYDIDAGTITRPKLDKDGHIYAVGDEVARETVTGKVEVSWCASRRAATGPTPGSKV